MSEEFTPGSWIVNVWTTGRYTIEPDGEGPKHPIAEVLPKLL